MQGGRLLCVGALTLDTIFRLDRLPSGSGKFLPSEAVQVAAGMATSAAAAAARQGGSVSLWASVGDDPVGAEMIAQLQAEGIDCSLVRRVRGGRSAIATILVDGRGERMIVPYYDPLTQQEPAGIPALDFSTLDAVLVDVRWPGAAALALIEARRHGIPAILDADVAPASILEKLAPLASHIVASLPAARILCGSEVAAADALEGLATRFGAFLAVTDGAEGTMFLDRIAGTVRHVPSPKVVAVDTLAAGDVFHGSFALALAEGLGIEPALRIASVAAAIKCRRFGGRLGAPTRAEIATFMDAAQRPFSQEP